MNLIVMFQLVAKAVGYCHFAMTTLNNKLLIAGGEDRSNNRTNEVLTLDHAGHCKGLKYDK